MTAVLFYSNTAVIIIIGSCQFARVRCERHESFVYTIGTHGAPWQKYDCDYFLKSGYWPVSLLF